MEIPLVEDDALVREAVQTLLETEGYHVTSAGNGREALDVLQQAARPNLIVLDLNMPQMDGREFRRAQRQMPACASVPVLVFSAEDGLPGQAASLQAASFLQKPVELVTLLRAVRRLAS